MVKGSFFSYYIVIQKPIKNRVLLLEEENENT